MIASEAWPLLPHLSAGIGLYGSVQREGTLNCLADTCDQRGRLFEKEENFIFIDLFTEPEDQWQNQHLISFPNYPHDQRIFQSTVKSKLCSCSHLET